MIVLLFILFIPYNYGRVTLESDLFIDMSFVFNWKQIGYDFTDIKYINDMPKRWQPGSLYFDEDLEDREKFFIRYNNVPIGLELYKNKMFITVPRRRFGIPSTLNYVDLDKIPAKLTTPDTAPSPLLKPYPSVNSIPEFVSVYRPRVDVCGRLWMVDTGLLEVPDNRVQVKQPEIIIFDLETDREILRYPFKQSDLFNGTTSGFISITVDVTTTTCNDAYAYINDLATGGLVVFSLRDKDSWRFMHPSFNYDPSSTFNLAQFTINWRDSIFSIALSDPDHRGVRTAYYHPFISKQEFSITTDVLKNRNGDFQNNFKFVGNRGSLSQSASHVYHGPTRTVLFANIAQNGVLCWNVDKNLTALNMALVAQHEEYLGYISDMKVNGDYLYLLVNHIHYFIYSTLSPTENNFHVIRARITELIKDTACDRSSTTNIQL